MKKTAFMVFMCACVLLGGCRRSPEAQAPLVRVVQAVSVEKDSQTVRHYSSPEKMSTMLNYLRLLSPKFPAPAEAETVDAPVYKITLHYSDGSETVYRQKGTHYLQTDNAEWKNIDPKFAWALEPMVKLMPSDDESADTSLCLRFLRFIPIRAAL